MFIWIIVTAAISFSAGIYFHEKYWPKLQAVLKQVL